MKNFISLTTLASFALIMGIQNIGKTQCMILDISQSSYNGSAISCAGANDGSIRINPVGNNGSVTYNWSNGASGSSLSQLSAGTYYVTATDQNGCMVTKSIVLNDPAPITFTTTVQTNRFGFNIDCNGGNNGYIDVLTSGGTGNVDIIWSNSVRGNYNGNLEAGFYRATATDKNGCTENLDVTLTEPLLLEVQTQINKLPSVPGASDAEVLAISSGGSGTHSYEWSSGEFTALSTQLPAGNHLVTVYDQMGCSSEAEVIIVDPIQTTINTRNVKQPTNIISNTNTTTTNGKR
jgi:hypothetical protein